MITLAEDYYFSAARNYAGLESNIEVVLVYLFKRQARTASPRHRVKK